MIGHEQAVTRIRGMIETNSVPTAILITGPTSVGKTTIARALAGTINGRPIDEQIRSSTYKELDGGVDRKIDDMRELIKLSRFKPQGGKKRVIVIDEAQQIVTNKDAASALLKPLEESGNKDTIWILCSMDPAKFKTSDVGKAILGRCAQIVLKPHTQDDMLTMAKRIVVREKMTYMKSNILLDKVIETCSAMRDVANTLQSISQYYNGLKKKPEKLGAEALASALDSMEQADDKMAADIVVQALKGQFAAAHLAVLNVTDTFTVINKMLWVATFLLNVRVLDGKKHPKVWWAPANRMAHQALAKDKISLGALAAMLEMCVQLKNESMNFTVDAQGLISSKVFRFIKDNSPKKE